MVPGCRRQKQSTTRDGPAVLSLRSRCQLKLAVSSRDLALCSCLQHSWSLNVDKMPGWASRQTVCRKRKRQRNFATMADVRCRGKRGPAVDTLLDADLKWPALPAAFVRALRNVWADTIADPSCCSGCGLLHIEAISRSHKATRLQQVTWIVVSQTSASASLLRSSPQAAPHLVQAFISQVRRTSVAAMSAHSTSAVHLGGQTVSTQRGHPCCTFQLAYSKKYTPRQQQAQLRNARKHSRRNVQAAAEPAGTSPVPRVWFPRLVRWSLTSEYDVQRTPKISVEQQHQLKATSSLS